MLPTKTLIAKIENLSNQLTPEQLSGFLDILDAMANMVEEAKAIPVEVHQSVENEKALFH